MSKLKAQAKRSRNPFPAAVAVGGQRRAASRRFGARSAASRARGQLADIRMLGSARRIPLVARADPRLPDHPPDRRPDPRRHRLPRLGRGEPSANLGKLAARFAKPRIEPGRDIPAQLRERGLDASDLKTVIMTHLHFDHSSGIAEYPQATFVLSKAEWEAATTDPRPSCAATAPPTTTTSSTTGSTSTDRDQLLRELRAHLRPLRRRQRPARLHAGALGRALLGDRPPARPRPRHRRRRDLHERPARGRRPAAAAGRHAPLAAILRELQQFARTYPKAEILPGHDPERWKTVAKAYE